jgi:hypothetical protein
MNTKIFFSLLASLLICILLLSSCSEDDRETPEETALCGNDVCDIHEQKRGSCPEDCGQTTQLPSQTTLTTPGTYTYDGNTPVYVTIYSHNEEGWEAMVGTRERYIAYREDLVERLNLIAEYEAKLDWQSDYGVLLAMIQYESEELWSTTNSKHILKYMVEDLEFSVEPHSHLTQYNYADIAHLFELNGITPSPIIGGVAAVECDNGNIVYNDWHEVIDLQDDGYIYGDIYPEATWKPTILSVPAMGGHWYDGYTSGVWIPGYGSTEKFLEQDPTQTIVYVGQGYSHNQNVLGAVHASGAPIAVKDGDYVKEIVSKIINGELPSGKIYAASIHLQDKAVNGDAGEPVDVNEGLRDILEELKPYVDRGEIQYATYEEVASIWREQYNAEPNILGLESFSVYDETFAVGQAYCTKEQRQKR